jgi:hypothetical protein
MAHRIDDNHHLMQLLFFVENIYNDFIKQRKELDTLTFSPLSRNTSVMTETGPYISSDLRRMINEVSFQYAESNYTYCNIPISIKIYKPASYSKRKVKMILELINFMIYYCKSVNQSFHDKLNIKIVLSPFKKELQGSMVLSAHNVNSGFTQRDYANGVSSIVVYREEEVVKVLIHELLHALDIDCKTRMRDDEQKFAKLFGMYTGVNINESFTDAYACLLNVVYCSMLLSRGQDTKQDIIKQVVKCETVHIVKIGHRILLNTSKQRQETTNVFAYYVLKAMIWTHLEGFCKYLKDHQFKIGSCKEFARYLYHVVQRNSINKSSGLMDNVGFQHKVNNIMVSDAVKKRIKHVKLTSIRMSSIDIL